MSFTKKQDEIDSLRDKLKKIEGHKPKAPTNTAMKDALLAALSPTGKQPNCS
jgi:hypothetical protein